MSDSETDTENSYIVVLSDTDENNDHSDDETDVDEVNLSVPNEEKNQNTVPETSSAESNTKCKLCNRVYSSSSNLKRHMMAEHKSTFVECSVSSCKEQIESNRMDQHLRRNHNLKKSHGENVTRRIGVRKSTRVSTQVIKTETTVPEVAEVICENHQITCEECNHRIILPKGIQLAHGQCINPTPKRKSTSTLRSGSSATKRRSRSSDENHNDHSQAKGNRSFTPNPVTRPTPSLAPRLIITKKEMQCCPACNVNFPNDLVATEHYQTIHKRNVVACKYCHKYLSSTMKLKSHVDTFHA